MTFGRIFLILVFSMVLFNQTELQAQRDSFYSKLKQFDFRGASESAINQQDSVLRASMLKLSSILENAGQKGYAKEDSLLFTEYDNHYSLDQPAKITTSLLLGYFHLFGNPYAPDAFINFSTALDIAGRVGNSEEVKFTLLSIISVYNLELTQSNDDVTEYIQRLEEVTSDNSDKYHCLLNQAIYQFRKISLDIRVPPELINDLTMIMNSFPKSHPFWVKYYVTIGIYHRSKYEYAAAREAELKAIALIGEEPYFRYLEFRALMQLAQLSRTEKAYADAIDYINEARNYAYINDPVKAEYYINKYIAPNYRSIGKVDEAFEAMYKADSLRSVLDYAQNSLNIALYNWRFQTEEKQSRIETQKATIALNTRIQLISTILLLIIISLLVLRFRATRLAAIKDKKLHNQEINQLMANQELRMIQAAIDAEEKERARMAEDLHDRLGSTLSATRMHLDVLEDEISEVPEDKTAKIKGLLDKAIEDTRQISHNMLSGVLAKFGLKAAIEDLRETVTSVNSVSVQVDYGKVQWELPKEVEVQVFRVIQELMSNTLKHAHADLVIVSFAQQEGSLQLIFDDDGLGFDQDAESNGIGLKNIESRLHKINAEYTYQSDERGTKITITIPT